MEQHTSDDVNPAPDDGTPAPAPTSDATMNEAAGPPPGDGTPDGPSEETAVGRGRWIAGAIAALGVALYAVPFLHGPDLASTDIGDVATCSSPQGTANFDFTLKDIDGVDVRLADFKGKVVLLNFWATWCGPCKVEIPEFVEAYEQYRDRGFVILGVLSQDDPSADDLRAFAKDWGMTYPILREHTELDEAFGPMWAIPTSFIIDRQGSICTKHLGPVPKETLERVVEGLL